ncbi:hypothetical protein BJ165DRAFT_762115 [Panaeolus papilionaceus]|nr:hypothetical protein BJ165DRAFT_762115 [Panaeolus papilionaceus]
MQLTANLAVLATAVAYTAPSVFALPLNVASSSIEARDYELDLEAREIAEFEARELQGLELTARDLIDEYYEARELYDELDARGLDSESLELREFTDFLDARAATPVAPAPTSTSAAATSTSASASPSATGASTPASGAPAPSASSTGGNGDGPVHHAHAHMPSVLIHALTDEHHPKLKHYAEIQLHIFNTLVDLTDGEPNHHGVKESPEVEKLAQEILQLKRWHRHHLHHAHKDGSHHHSAHKDGEKPAHEKHDSAKDATPSSAATPSSPSGTPAAGSGHHAHHDLYHAKIHELKIGSHKADRYIARAKLHKDRLALIALGPGGEHDEAYKAAVKHEKDWLERHQKRASQLHNAAGSSGAPAPTSTSAGAAPSATGAEKAKSDKPAEAAGPKTAQGVKRRALRRRGFF